MPTVMTRVPPGQPRPRDGAQASVPSTDCTLAESAASARPLLRPASSQQQTHGCSRDRTHGSQRTALCVPRSIRHTRSNTAEQRCLLRRVMCTWYRGRLAGEAQRGSHHSMCIHLAGAFASSLSVLLGYVHGQAAETCTDDVRALPLPQSSLTLSAARLCCYQAWRSRRPSAMCSSVTCPAGT